LERSLKISGFCFLKSIRRSTRSQSAFTDLHKYVIALPGFKDDPAKSNEAKLEAIQMAWHAEVLDRTQG
jgi:FeS assembly protein IscX